MSIDALSAIDGRYEASVAPLKEYLSEVALIRARVIVEVEWLIHLAAEPTLPAVRQMHADEVTFLRQLAESVDNAAAAGIKEIERTTNHDVKAVEYWIKRNLTDTTLADLSEWVHFACTSEDINNLSHALMLKGAVGNVMLPKAEEIVSKVRNLANPLLDAPLLSRTHGQPASPSTLGKELAVFVHRWNRQLTQISAIPFLGKINGAVGAFNAHVVAFPHANWPDIAERFVSGLGLTYNPLTTQIESHDYMAELFHAWSRFLTILLDFDRDIWAYISIGVFRQKTVAGEIGSSTMPHKVNPIDFENSEANIGLAVSLFDHLGAKLQVSRLQRDLSDSSAIRAIGTAFGHALLALVAAGRGIGKLEADRVFMLAELDRNWEVLAEPIQTVMRVEGLDRPYERLKELTRGQRVDAAGMLAFLDTLELSEDALTRLKALRPETYIGIAPQLGAAALGDS
jgi:adenylosuccinate lyase